MPNSQKPLKEALLLRKRLPKSLLITSPLVTDAPKGVYLLYDNDNSLSADSSCYKVYCVRLNGKTLIYDQHDLITKLYPIAPYGISFVNRPVYLGDNGARNIITIIHDHMVVNSTSQHLGLYLYLGRSLATIHEAIVGLDTQMFGHYRLYAGAYAFTLNEVLLLLKSQRYLLIPISNEILKQPPTKMYDTLIKLNKLDHMVTAKNTSSDLLAQDKETYYLIRDFQAQGTNLWQYPTSEMIH